MRLKLYYLLILVLGLCCSPACSDDDDDNDVQQSNVPTSVTDAFKAKYPDVDVKNVKWEQKSQYLVAEFKQVANQEDVEAWFTTDAQWKMTETDYHKDLFLIPTVINSAIRDAGYIDWTIDDIALYEYPESTSDFYLIEVEKTGQPDTNLFFKTDGTLIKKITGSMAEITPDTVI